MQRWAHSVDAAHPDGWLTAGGPIRTARSAHGTHHVANYTGFGGYDLCGRVDPETPRRAAGGEQR